MGNKKPNAKETKSCDAKSHDAIPHDAKPCDAKPHDAKLHDALIVDGYNVLRSSGLYAVSETIGFEAFGAQVPDRVFGGCDTRIGSGAHTASVDFTDYTHDHYNAARDALINDVAMFALRSFDATVVFDGAGNPASSGEYTEIAGTKVIFSAGGISADATIEELVHKAVADGRKVVVITSDATLQWTVLGKHVTRMSAAGFADEIRGIKKAAVNDVNMVTQKNTLGERLDEDTRLRLARMARGLE